MDHGATEFEQNFDINDISFKNVSSEFEDKFREKYRQSLKMMSDSRDRFMNLNGANSLEVLEKMARHIEDYDSHTSFEESYREVLKENERFTET